MFNASPVTRSPSRREKLLKKEYTLTRKKVIKPIKSLTNSGRAIKKLLQKLEAEGKVIPGKETDFKDEELHRVKVLI